TTRWKAFAVTVPFVPGVHASGWTTSTAFIGETMCASTCSFAHPGWPNSQGSRWALVKPHSVICFAAHSAAALWFGGPVSRGPYTSVRKCIVRMICECDDSSWRILSLILGSVFDCASGKAAASATSKATENVRYFMTPHYMRRDGSHCLLRVSHRPSVIF